MADRKKTTFNSGFSLAEMLLVLGLTSIVIAAITSFFLAFSQNSSWNQVTNEINFTIRSTAQTIKKDLQTAIECYVLQDFNAISSFDRTTDRSGSCLLIVSTQGLVQGGSGVIYYRNATTHERWGRNVNPLQRVGCTFAVDGSNNLTITVQNETTRLLIHDIIGLDPSDAQNIFHMKEKQSWAGSRCGVFIRSLLQFNTAKNLISEANFNLSVYCRNPQFDPTFNS